MEAVVRTSDCFSFKTNSYMSINNEHFTLFAIFNVRPIWKVYAYIQLLKSMYEMN